MAENPLSFDDRVKAIIEEYLTDTNNLPKKFKSWVPEWVTVSEPAMHLESMVGNLNANRISANSISADKLEAVLTLVSALLAGSPEAARVEMGYGITIDGDGNAVIDNSFTGIRAFDGDGNLIFKLDAGGGTAQFKGRVTFGTDSRLTTNDMIEVVEQPGGSFATPTLEQSSSSTDKNSSTVSWSLDADPTLGNELILVITLWDAGGAPTITTPTGYTLIQSHGFSGGPKGRQAAYRKSSDGTDTAGTATLSGSTDMWIAEIFEYSGVADTEDGSSDRDTGSSSPANSGTTGTITQSDLVFATFAISGNFSFNPLVNPSFVTLDSDYTQVSQTSTRLGVGGKPAGTELGSLCATKIASSGTETAEVTLEDVDDWAGIIFTLEAASNSVTSATADSARLYAADVSDVSLLHSVDENGEQRALALGKAGERWDFEVLSIAVDLPSTSAHSGNVANLTATGVAVGDYVAILGGEDGTARNFALRPRSPAGNADQIDLDYFNTDASTSDPISFDVSFLVIHRS